MPKLNQAEESTLKGQQIKLGMYIVGASFAAEAKRTAKDETPYAAYLARLSEVDMRIKLTGPSARASLARASVAAEVPHNLGKVLAHLRYRLPTYPRPAPPTVRRGPPRGGGGKRT